jgi:hypothetical protein
MVLVMGPLTLMPSPPESPLRGCLTANSPGDFLDADLLTLLFIIVIPLAFKEVNASESGSRLNTLGFPFTLN